MKYEEWAENLLAEIFRRDDAKWGAMAGGYDLGELGLNEEALVEALRRVERETWEKAAKETENNKESGDALDELRKAFLAKAEEAGG